MLTARLDTVQWFRDCPVSLYSDEQRDNQSKTVTEGTLKKMYFDHFGLVYLEAISTS